MSADSGSEHTGAERQSASDLANRRREGRRDVQASLRLVVESESIAGVSDNLSNVGVLFFTKEPLRVRIEVDEPGGVRTYRGRLVRVQRMGSDSTGLAVEFDKR